MKKDKNNQKDESASVKEFEGYTLDEIKYQRALLLIKREYLRESALAQVNDIKKRLPFSGGKSTLAAIKGGGLLSRVVKGLNYMDYLMLGASAFQAGRKIVSLFRRKK